MNNLNPYFNLLRTVWENGKPWRRAIVGYYCAYIIAQTSLGLSPYAFGQTINILQNFKPSRLSEVIYWLMVSVAVLIIFWLFHGPARVVERRVALKIQQAFRLNFYEKLTQLPLKWHQDHHSGNIITRASRASIALQRFAGDQFIYIETIIKLFVSIGFLLWISLPLGLLNLITCMLAITTVILFDKKLIPLYDAQNEIDNRIGAVLFDYISNMTTVLTLRLGRVTRSNLYQRLMKVWPFFKKEVVLNEVKWCTMGVLLTTLQALILITYIVYTLHTAQAIMIGIVVMIFRYQYEVSEVFYVFSAQYSELVRMNTDVQGINPVLEDMKRLAHQPQGKIIARKWHRLNIERLYFHHAGNEKHDEIINNIRFSLLRGEKIALLGQSGSGKTTLLNLLRGLYPADAVDLVIDKARFNSLEPLQTITSLIPQDPEIFENTIRFNITMDVECSLEEINWAIHLAGFSKVLAKLPLGLETDIREKGLNLSVGQKQRLALARGLFAARSSSLILMDEPTSSVDLVTETEILSGVIEAFPDAAMLVSLHRLHLLPKFDRIMMLSHGKIIADGLSIDLLSKPGPVYDLWHAYQHKS